MPPTHSPLSLFSLPLSLCACVLSALSFLFKWSTSGNAFSSSLSLHISIKAARLQSGRGLLCCEIEPKTKGELLGTFASVKHIMHHHYEARQREQGIARVTESTVSCFPPHSPPPPFTGIALTNCADCTRHLPSFNNEMSHGCVARMLRVGPG